ncbi:MAG: cell division protein ZapB [Verrucomicrobiota bacterium]|jgi:DNA-binding MarR family transcriptional regulator
MGATDTIKEFARIATTAGLTKDVIDLLDKKAVLLAEQVAALEKDNAALTQENTTLLRESRNLKLENENLKTQLQNARPRSDELDPKTKDILVCFFNNPSGVSDGEIAHTFQMKVSMAAYHTDILLKKRFIDQIVAGYDARSATYCLTDVGRKYVVENKLAG